MKAQSIRRPLLDEIIDDAMELPLESQNLLLILAKCIAHQSAHPDDLSSDNIMNKPTK